MFLLIKLLTVRYVVCAICTLLSLFSANVNATTKTAVLSRAVVCTLLFGCFHLSLRLKWELSNAMAYIVYVVWPWVPFFGVLSRCPGIAAKCPGFKKNSHDLNDKIYSTTVFLRKISSTTPLRSSLCFEFAWVFCHNHNARDVLNSNQRFRYIVPICQKLSWTLSICYILFFSKRQAFLFKAVSCTTKEQMLEMHKNKEPWKIDRIERVIWMWMCRAMSQVSVDKWIYTYTEYKVQDSCGRIVNK